MSKKYIVTIIITAIVAVGIAESRHFFTQDISKNTETSTSTIHSPYAGQETRGIKALSESDIEGLLAGSGTPFGGLAKPAELNGYPGPRHVLDAIEAGEFKVTTEQKGQIEMLYNEMKPQAIALGEQIVAVEEEIDKAFASQTMTETLLKQKIAESTDLYRQLRTVHLSYHFPMDDGYSYR